MSLTPKQEAFTLAYLELGDASKAYRKAYNAAKMKPESVNRKAKELMDNVKITARIEELRTPAREAAQVTLRQHLDDLKRLRDKAEKAAQYSAAINAEALRGKAAGLYVDRQELTGKDGAPLVAERKISFKGMSVEEMRQLDELLAKVEEV